MANEQRLIDYQKAKEIVLDILGGKITTVTAVQLATMLKGATVDAVEVICCKDCVQWHKSPSKGFHYCMYTMTGRVTKPDDFCSYGERREGE